MEYLNQEVDISQDENGWIASWRYEAGVIEIGFFVTHHEAQDAIINLIKRDAAVKALSDIVRQWEDACLITEDESQFLQFRLMEYTFDQED
jgi:transcriptional regulator CtsR